MGDQGAGAPYAGTVHEGSAHPVLGLRPGMREGKMSGGITLLRSSVDGAVMKQKIEIALQMCLAFNAAIVVSCLANGWQTWGWIILYWVLLTVKNIIGLA